MLATALAAVMLAAGMAACGGDDETSSGDTGATAAQQTSPGGSGDRSSGGAADDRDRSQGGDRGGSGTKDSGNEAAEFTPKPHRDSGGGSAQYRVKGGDNSVQEFGQEGEPSDFEAAATALHNFLDARAEGNWDAACRYMAKSSIESFEQLAARASSNQDKSCGSILEAIVNPAARQSMREEAAKADIGSLRVEDGRAFLIYTAGGETILAMPMTEEGGEWKVAGLAGTPLN